MDAKSALLKTKANVCFVKHLLWFMMVTVLLVVHKATLRVMMEKVALKGS